MNKLRIPGTLTPAQAKKIMDNAARAPKYGEPLGVTLDRRAGKVAMKLTWRFYQDQIFGGAFRLEGLPADSFGACHFVVSKSCFNAGAFTNGKYMSANGRTFAQAINRLMPFGLIYTASNASVSSLGNPAL